MAPKDSDPEIKAHQEVYGAIKELDSETRTRVLSSVLALLGGPPLLAAAIDSGGPSRAPAVPAALAPASSRPVSLIELMQEKNPGTNAERIALFAYYREKVEDLQRFERRDLQPYFAKARLSPSANYDRDFVEAVKRGWIHEDGADSYLTSKGVEAVESSFAGQTKKVSGKSAKKTGKSSKRKSSVKRSK
jgi:hypothetical protein